MPAIPQDGLLIAETNESGKVTWVWVLKNGDRFPRPLHRNDASVSLDRFRLSGARREEIASWVGRPAH